MLLVIADLEYARADFHKMVPIEFHRKFYWRIYKWYLAFSTWHHSKPHLESLMKQLQECVTLDETELAAQFQSSAHGSIDSDSLPPYTASLSISKSTSRTPRSESNHAHQTPNQSHSATKAGQTSAMAPKQLFPVSDTKLLNKAKLLQMSASRATKSSYTMPEKAIQHANKIIPFSERQSKSTVAAREMLKKASKVCHLSLSIRYIIRMSA